MCNKEKITVEALRSMRKRQTSIFCLESGKDCVDARALIYNYANVLDCKFEIRTDFEKFRVAVTMYSKDNPNINNEDLLTDDDANQTDC